MHIRCGTQVGRWHTDGVSRSIRVRDYADADWAAFEPILREVVEEGTTYALDPAIDDSAARAFWGAAAHRAVATDPDGALLGGAKMGPNRPAQGAHVGTASFLVAGAARGQGVGRALGEYAVQWHRAHGFRAIQFNAVVSTNTGAIALWRSLGFEIVGTVPDAFRLPDASYADLHVMHLALDRT